MSPIRPSRIALGLAGALLLGFAASSGAAGQDAPNQAAPTWKPGLDLMVSTGEAIPTGARRDAVDRGKIALAELSYALHPSLAMNVTLGWTRTRDLAAAAEPKLDVFTYDVGPEVRGRKWTRGERVSFRPFAGAGVGARSYNYRSLPVDATHHVAGYAALGGQLVVKRLSMRLEARDYVSDFKGMDGQGDGTTHNEVVIVAGIKVTR
ncbi:MAG: hypothetical protein AMXMBFR53_22400 [Gemmatimonadota bacterium]